MERSRSTVRLNRPLAHVTLMTEGVRPKLGELRNFIRRYEPGARKDSVTLLEVVIGRWPEQPVDYIVRSTTQTWEQYFCYGGSDLTFEELRDSAGLRTLILRVYYNPHELFPNDMEQRVVTLNAHERKKESGWLSKLFGG